MEGWLDLSHPFFFVSVGNADIATATAVDVTNRSHVPRSAVEVHVRRQNKNLIEIISIRFYGAAAGARIPDSQIKSLILCQLSYSNMSYTYVSLVYRFLRSRRNCKGRHCGSRSRRGQKATHYMHCRNFPWPAKYQYFTYIRYIVFKSDDFSVWSFDCFFRYLLPPYEYRYTLGHGYAYISFLSPRKTIKTMP